MVRQAEDMPSTWVDILEKAAEERWAEGRPLFLAQIPPLLWSKGIDAKNLTAGRSLRETIATEGAETLQLIRDPNRELVWAVVPRSEDLPSDLSPLFQKTIRSSTSAASTPPRYKKWFWAAFIKALGPGQVRYILSDQWIDISESSLKPRGGVLLTTGDIVKSEPAVIDDEVLQAITEWAQRNGVRLEQYYQDSPQGERSSDINFDLRQLASLNLEDLKRITVPLDIVLKLMRHKP